MLRKTPFLDEFIMMADVHQLQTELKKYYTLPSGENQFPKDAYLLLPGVLKAHKIEQIHPSQVRIHIWYRENFRGFVNLNMEISYEVIRKGSILCKGVSSFHELPYEGESRIHRTFVDLCKILTVPLENKSSVQIRCRKIIIESIGNYVLHAGSMMTHDDFIKSMALLNG